MLTILEGGIGKGIGPLSVIGPGGFQKTIGVTALAAGLVVAGGLACLAIMLASAAKNGDTVKVIADVLLATGLILTGFGVITAMGRVVRAVAEKGSLAKVRQAALGLSTNLKNSWELTKCLTTVVAIAMNFLVFMMQWGSGMAVGSLGWDARSPEPSPAAWPRCSCGLSSTRSGPSARSCRRSSRCRYGGGLHLHAHRRLRKTARGRQMVLRRCHRPHHQFVQVGDLQRQRDGGYEGQGPRAVQRLELRRGPPGTGDRGRQRDQYQGQCHQHGDHGEIPL